MKNLLFLLLLAIPLSAPAKGKKSFKRAVGQFVAAYNSGDPGSLYEAFSPKSRDRGRFTRAKLVHLKDRYRSIKSYSFSHEREDGMHIFVVKFAKPRYDDPSWIPNAWLGVWLDDKGKILKLRFPTPGHLDGKERYLLTTN